MRYKFAPCLILALALLSGCGREAPAAPDLSGTVEETTQPNVSTQTPEETPEVEEIPITINPDSAESGPLEPVPAEVTATDDVVEGLVEDAVGYSFALPVFSGADGADAMTQFYKELIPELEFYVQDTVYSKAMELHTVASVYGSYTLDGVQDGALVVSYEVRAEYSDHDPVTSSRTDHFDLTTGEHLMME